MKKLGCTLLCLIFCIGLAACSSVEAFDERLDHEILYLNGGSFGHSISFADPNFHRIQTILSSKDELVSFANENANYAFQPDSELYDRPLNQVLRTLDDDFFNNYVLLIISNQWARSQENIVVNGVGILAGDLTVRITYEPTSRVMNDDAINWVMLLSVCRANLTEVDGFLLDIKGW